MVKLKTQKRLAASILNCGKRKVWLDPNEGADINNANSRRNIRRLIKDGLIMKKPQVVHSRFRAKRRIDEKRKGRHMGLGKRQGTKNARMPSKILWIRRSRVLRRMLKKYREQGKIDRHLYRSLYQRAKGNAFKNKRNLMENIHREKAEQKRAQMLKEQAEAQRLKNRLAKERRAQRAQQKKDEFLAKYEAEKLKLEQGKEKTPDEATKDEVMTQETEKTAKKTKSSSGKRSKK
eukprot:TRINITY_DN12755_c0_g1_i1.p1 TRINITY_DN12755_c0_g1~~TRINITY_DN12755_c0_g1_i1.p1  ORF type:complete len:234 (-),score=48.48 TRINITY_DN12755_c0_g1_i1:53-754(-)